MKTIEELNQLIAIETKIRTDKESTSAQKRKAKSNTEFLRECVLLIEAGVGEDYVKKELNALQRQYAFMKDSYYERETRMKDGKEIKPKIGKFHKETGAEKIKRQIKNLIFLQ